MRLESRKRKRTRRFGLRGRRQDDATGRRNEISDAASRLTPLSNPSPPSPRSSPDGTVIRLPVLADAAGQTFVDIQRLYPAHKICAFDPGFNSTASCRSAITFIDGERGRLTYRGYPIEDLAARGDMADCACLLLRGTLPNKTQRGEFRHLARVRSYLHWFPYYRVRVVNADP